MNLLPVIVAAVCVTSLSACSALDVLLFNPDEERSGITQGQRVEIAYVGRGKKQADCPSGDIAPGGCIDLTAAEVPKEVQDLCARSASEPAVAAALVPFILAGAQVAYDTVLGAIDSRRAELKKAAVKEYGATAVAPNLTISAKHYESPQCVVVTRYVQAPGSNKEEKAEERAMLLVNYLKPHFSTEGSLESGPTIGFTWTTVYLRIDKAAAQTTKLSDDTSKVALTQSLVISAIQANPETGAQSVDVLSASTFQHTGIEIGVPYINTLVAGKPLDPPKKWKDLKVPDGPLFVGLREAPTVGAISVAITERGAAAALDDVSDAEKSLRNALRAAIGKSLESHFGE